MKSLITLLLLTSFNAFAADICAFEETWEFHEALEAEGVKAVKTSKNSKRFTFVEKQMIHLTVAQQDWLKGISKEEAWESFSEGSSDGEVLYYKLDGKDYALVHYWPGDNEFGAFYEMKNGAYRIIATIDDAFITCK